MFKKKVRWFTSLLGRKASLKVYQSCVVILVSLHCLQPSAALWPHSFSKKLRRELSSDRSLVLQTTTFK